MISHENITRRKSVGAAAAIDPVIVGGNIPSKQKSG